MVLENWMIILRSILRRLYQLGLDILFKKIYDVLGRSIKTINYGYKNAGRYKVNFDGNNLSSGVYFYQVQFEN